MLGRENNWCRDYEMTGLILARLRIRKKATMAETWRENRSWLTNDFEEMALNIERKPFKGLRPRKQDLDSILKLMEKH